MHVRRFHLAAGFAAAALFLSACGGGDESTVTQGQPAGDALPAHSMDGGGMQHIHGLGVRGGTLYIATHNGLWVARDGQTKGQRLGESQQDIMGFSVVSDNRLIGSGHPHPSQNMPPNLGLIESRDDGKSWKNISLLGEADFHVLESTERGLFVSPNAGKGWRPVDEQLAGLLAWPRAEQLYLVDGQGQVRLSRDGGRQWQVVGSIGGEPAAFIATGGDLYAALGDGSVKRSTDGGRAWTVRATP